MSGKAAGKRPIIIRREEVVQGGHHGGAWKVAYADFVTAMMAFFLLMWLLNATTDEQRRGLADYFSPTNPMAHGASGAGQPFGGKTPFETGEMVSDRGVMSVVAGRNNQRMEADEATPETSVPSVPILTSHEGNGGEGEGSGKTMTPLLMEVVKDRTETISPDAKMRAMVGAKTLTAAAVIAQANAEDVVARAEQSRREGKDFERAAQQIRDAMRGDKLLSEMSSQLAIDVTPEGLRIQLLDEDRRPMFPLGSAVMNERARQLLLKMAPVLMKLSEPIAIAGHTDAAAFHTGDTGNWELSSERANATRRVLAQAGLPEARIRSVTGHADRDLLLPADPLAAANRRIAIIVLHNIARPVAGIVPGVTR